MFFSSTVVLIHVPLTDVISSSSDNGYFSKWLPNTTQRTGTAHRVLSLPVDYVLYIPCSLFNLLSIWSLTHFVECVMLISKDSSNRSLSQMIDNLLSNVITVVSNLYSLTGHQTPCARTVVPLNKMELTCIKIVFLLKWLELSWTMDKFLSDFEEILFLLLVISQLDDFLYSYNNQVSYSVLFSHQCLHSLPLRMFGVYLYFSTILLLVSIIFLPNLSNLSFWVIVDLKRAIIATHLACVSI